MRCVRCVCVLLQLALAQVVSQNATDVPLTTTDVDPVNRTQYCKWPCKCPKSATACPPGVSLLKDGCDCCKVCAKQPGETCNERDTCDYHKGLYCDYSADKPRYEKGVCAYVLGTGCEYDGVIYRNGQSFQPSLALSTNEIWHKNCITQTSPWSPCSKTCGRGVSMRITNDNAQCEMEKETRLCNIRPCEVDITKYFRPGKMCLNIYREQQFQNFTISGCVSRKPYWPKYCGVCSDERCCIPYKSKTIEVEFECPNGSVFTWKYMWINACFCNLSCRNPNDIFAELEPFLEPSEIMN